MIIGLVGYKGSGKTTACNIIKKHLTDVVQINFKDALIGELKDKFPDLLLAIVETMYDLGIDTSVDDLFSDKPALVRTLMQNYGTEVRRVDNSDWWVDEWEVSIDYGLHGCSNVLTDDVRFQNEAMAIKDAGGILIRIERSDIVTTDQHLSEVEQQSIECDYTISVGKGELEQLESELVKIIT